MITLFMKNQSLIIALYVDTISSNKRLFTYSFMTKILPIIF